MAVSEVVVRSGDADQESQVPIEGRTYTLRLRWSGREARWYLDISDEDGDPIYTGVAVVLNFPLAIRCASSALWPGVLMTVDTSGSNEDPTLDDLGERVKLYYFDTSELPIQVDA